MIPTKNENHRMYRGTYNFKKEPKCTKCSVDLVADREDSGFNWRPALVVRHWYLCSSCHNDMKSYYYYLRKAKNFSKQIASFNSEYIQRFNQIKEGFVYVLTNPAWKGWIKVGMAVDADDRCNAYQTGSPHRDYTVQYKRFFKNRREAEEKAHLLLSEISSDVNGEWFNVTEHYAQEVIDSI
jgi:hypothetical protein